MGHIAAANSDGALKAIGIETIRPGSSAHHWSEMIRKLTLFFILMLAGVVVSMAQDQGAVVETPALPPDAAPPIVTFTQAWPQATPPFYSISVESTGRTSYYSAPSSPSSGDPYTLKFTMSEEMRTRVFDIAKQLNYFRGSFDYRKSKIAFTGTKTLKFINGEQKNQTSYNWSDNLAVQQLTKLFQDISETVELGRVISEKYRFDKLGMDAEMKKLEQAAKDDRVAELQSIQPLLSRIAKDSSLMNITRHRAEVLLAKIPKGAKINGQH